MSKILGYFMYCCVITILLGCCIVAMYFEDNQSVGQCLSDGYDVLFYLILK
jgi:hypothetical protein